MKNYGVLKGKALEFARDDDRDPHSEVLIVAAGRHRIAVNVRSSRGPGAQRWIEYALLANVAHPLLEHARALPDGFTDLRGSQQPQRGVDYIRSNLFRAQDMAPIVHTQPGEDNDLFEKIERLVQRAIRSNATVYAYGEKWGPETSPDQYFGFTPGSGIHLIHMNQGDADNPNGKYQDGALFFEFSPTEVAGLFLKFQNQSWHTDEASGDPIAGAPVTPVLTPEPGEPVDPWPVVADDSPYHLARIVGAMVNPAGDDVGRETVTIFNTADRALDLKGWQILDQRDHSDMLSGTLPVGEARTFTLTGRGAQLSNKGGTITLLDGRGLKVDGVAYTQAAISQQGRAIVFGA